MFWVRCLFLLTASCSAALSGESGRRPGAVRKEVSIPDPAGRLRVTARPGTKGYEIIFEVKGRRGFETVARFPVAGVWRVYSEWKHGWCVGPRGFVPTHVSVPATGRLEVSAEGSVADHRWRFKDIYSFEKGMIRIDRSFEHLEDTPQTTLTLETRIRVRVDRDPRLLIPANNYNNNPSMLPSLPGPRMTEGYVPGALVAYEEHRLPIPYVSVESSVGGERLYGALLARPGKIPGGNKAPDHWWSLGVEWGKGYADLLSLSGPVATNGKRSQVYGHRNAFDRYDDTCVAARGRTVFRKTLYLDIGCGVRTGYAFRETLWKAYEVFRPSQPVKLSFRRAMELKKGFVKKYCFYKNEHGAAGHTIWPGADHIQYGWVGGALATACGLLYDSGITGDLEGRDQATASVDFFVRSSPDRTPGLFLCEYFGGKNEWSLSPFHGGGAGVAARQFSEVLNHLAECILVGRDQGLDTAAWERKLARGCDFLVRTPKYKGLLPRGWTPEGAPLEWKGGEKYKYSTAGAYAVEPLVTAWRLTKKKAYLDTAESLLEAYYRTFGETLKTPFWGGTNDAGCEDKEAGWPVMAGSLALFEATGEKRYLEWARDAADWTLTWTYFHDIDLPSDPVLDSVMNTCGWTFISLHNQEIDVFGYWMAPDYYRLGLHTGEERYKRLGKLLFDAPAQTIARPGTMLGLPHPGMQSEHYNHTNCTFLPDGKWRGQQHAAGIGWVSASQLMGGTRLCRYAPLVFSLRAETQRQGPKRYAVKRRAITIDGNASDWEGIPAEKVAGPGHLWFGQGMTRWKWRGDEDLSFSWRAAWNGGKLYFLFDVTDDKLIDPPRQPNSFLNDCIEILLDPGNRGGRRFLEEGGKKVLRGYEMHFLPSSPPLVFLDDALSPMYPISAPQNDLFAGKWRGEIAVKKREGGYVVELGFSVPGMKLVAGKEFGLDLDVCDDDGGGRKALQLWSGLQVEFWITMDHYGKAVLVE